MLFRSLAKEPFTLTGKRFQEESAIGRQTETPEFTRWFGDSKVVDSEGKPLVVYHGTTSNEAFSEFRTKGYKARGYHYGEGAYFTPEPGRAAEYADFSYSKLDEVLDAGPDSKVADRAAKNNKIYPVYLSIKNPFRTSSDAGVMQIGHDLYKENPAEYSRLAQKISKRNGYSDEKSVGTQEVGNELLREEGYDGIIKEWKPNEPLEIVAFHPEQIKSAIGNNGNFDPTNPDIRYQEESALSKEIPLEKQDYAKAQPHAYGHWIAPDGTMFRVGTFKHREAGLEIIRHLVANNKLPAETLAMAEKAAASQSFTASDQHIMDILFEAGWIRGVGESSKYYHLEGNKINNAQQRAAKNYGIEIDSNVSAELQTPDGIKRLRLYERKNDLHFDPTNPDIRYQEESALGRRSFNPLLTSRFDKIAERHPNETGRYVTEKFHTMRADSDRLAGQIGNKAIALIKDYTPEEVQRVDRYRHALSIREDAPYQLTPRETQLKNAMDRHYRAVGQMHQDSGMMVRNIDGSFRQMILNPEGYRPSMLSNEVAYTWAENVQPKAREYDRLLDRKSTRLNSSHVSESRMPSSA